MPDQKDVETNAVQFSRRGETSTFINDQQRKGKTAQTFFEGQSDSNYQKLKILPYELMLLKYMKYTRT